jgi:cytochrome P450
LIARGLIVRRPRIVGLLDRVDADRRAVRRLQHLHGHFGSDPAVLRVLGRRVAVVLSEGDARRVLAETPVPFTPATWEKRAALGRFEPHGVLISRGAARERRRRANEQMLQTDRPVHSLGPDIAHVVEAEVEEMLTGCAALTWSRFAGTWWRIVRRIVLGDGARDDELLTGDLTRLRSDANWGPLASRRNELRDRFLSRLRGYVIGAPLDSLAGHAAAVSGDVNPAEQIPQWLFAFDAAGMAAFRTLALLDAHPAVDRMAREELTADPLAGDDPLPILRASVLESLRLWPTTPAILRETTAETRWSGGTLPSETTLLIFAPYFHRNPRTLAVGDAFSPALWRDGTEPSPLLMPFSLGPARCPGRQIVLLTTSLLLARVLAGRTIVQTHPRPLRADRPLPATLSPFRLQYSIDTRR